MTGVRPDAEGQPGAPESKAGGGLPRGSGSRRGSGGGSLPGGSGFSRAGCGGTASSDGSGACLEEFFPARAGVLHIGEGRPRGSTSSFPHDYGIFLECWFSVGGLPCAERAPLHMGGFQRR